MKLQTIVSMDYIQFIIYSSRHVYFMGFAPSNKVSTKRVDRKLYHYSERSSYADRLFEALYGDVYLANQALFDAAAKGEKAAEKQVYALVRELELKP